METFLGIDVGTGSVRAGLFDKKGRLLASARRPIVLWQEPNDVAEQSSEDIWAAVGAAAHETLKASSVDVMDVRGVGFDATCSLVAIDPIGQPVGIGYSGDDQRNIIVWMDHRAVKQAQRINSTEHPVLSYVGGAISPEMQTPKLLWLVENKPDAFARAGHFFDLPDWLTYRATGSLERSACTVTCKWTYLAHEKRWDESYFRLIGLGALANERFARIGTRVVEPGTALGGGLTPEAARDLGLRPGTSVGAALIDAHAGGIASLGARDPHGERSDPRRQMAYIFGTSACAMSSTDQPHFVPGVWGPYYSAMIPGMWLNEGGQSAAGAAIDRILTLHPGYARCIEQAKQEGISILSWIERELLQIAPDSCTQAKLASHINVVPDFLGNRSPLADPYARATIVGLGFDSSPQGLCELFLSGLCGIAYGARQIVEALNKHGSQIEALVLSGGAGRSLLVRQVLADATGLDVRVVETPEPVLLGAAMLGAVASGVYPTIADAMFAMSRASETYCPVIGSVRLIHDAKYAVFLSLQATEEAARTTMAEVLQMGRGSQ